MGVRYVYASVYVYLDTAVTVRRGDVCMRM